MSKNSTQGAKKSTKNEKKKGVNFFFVLVEFVLCSFLIASVSMHMILPAIISAFLAVFITSFPDFVLEKLGKGPMNRNIRFAVGAIGFVLLCYVVPDSKIAEVRQRQVDAAGIADTAGAVGEIVNSDIKNTSGTFIKFQRTLH